MGRDGGGRGGADQVLFTKKEQSLGNNFRLHIHIWGCGEVGDKEEGLARQRGWETQITMYSRMVK